MDSEIKREFDRVQEAIGRVDNRVEELAQNARDLRDRFPGFDLTEAILKINDRLTEIEKALSIAPEKDA